MSTRTGLVLVREGAAAAQAEDEVQRGLLLYVVVGESAPVLELLPGEDEALLVGGGASLPWICCFTFSMVSDGYTPSAIVLPESSSRRSA